MRLLSLLFAIVLVVLLAEAKKQIKARDLRDRHPTPRITTFTYAPQSNNTLSLVPSPPPNLVGVSACIDIAAIIVPKGHKCKVCLFCACLPCRRQRFLPRHHACS